MLVQGCYHVNGFDGGFHIRLKFRCPNCHRRHTEFVECKDKPSGIEVQAQCGEMIRVLPYRPL